MTHRLARLVGTLFLTITGLVVIPVAPHGPLGLGASQTFAAVPGFSGVTPARLLDTRSGLGAPAAPVGAGASIDLQVTGRGGVPASGVTAVVLNVTAAAPTATSYLTVWPTGAPQPNASSLNYVAGQTVPNLVIVKVGNGGRVSMFNAAGSVHLLADVSGWYGTGSEFTSITPTRLLDTRNGTGGVAGPTSGTVDVVVAERGGVPLGATSVVMNVTVAAPTSAGYLTIWPKGVSQPNASNLNFAAGQTVPNLVISKIGAEGKISYYSSSGKVHVLIDVLGYISTQTPVTELLNEVDYNDYRFDESTTPVQGTPRFNSLTLVTSVDSACSISNPSWTEYNLGRQWKTLATTLAFDDARSTATSKVRFRILGDGVELVNRTLTFGQTADVTANVTNVLRVRFEVLNANATASTCSRYPTFATPTLSQTASAPFPPKPDFNPVVPSRILDTRDGTGAAKGRVAHQGIIDLQVMGRGGIPDVGVGAVVMNVTVTQPDAGGYLTAWPTGQSRPDASNLNFSAAQTIPNLVIVPVGAGGRVSIYNYSGPTHILADVLGWYAGTTDARPTSVNLTETLDEVDYNDYRFDEITTPVQGTPRFNSLTLVTSVDSACSISNPSWTEYNLGRQWKTLATTLAFDDARSTATSKVRFRILGDGVELVNRTLTFGQTADVTANVTNVLRVRFEVLNANATASTCSRYPTFATPTLSR